MTAAARANIARQWVAIGQAMATQVQRVNDRAAEQPAPDDDAAALRELRAANAALLDQLADAQALINDLKAQLDDAPRATSLSPSPKWRPAPLPCPPLPSGGQGQSPAAWWTRSRAVPSAHRPPMRGCTMLSLTPLAVPSNLENWSLVAATSISIRLSLRKVVRMGLQTIIPGDKAIHRATGAVVQVMSYADGRFDCRAYDGPGLTTAIVSGPVDAFEPYTSRTPAPKAADPALSATAQRIADLQAQVADLQNKLQAAERSRDETAARAAELLAQPEPAPKPAAITAPKIEVRSIYDVSDATLAKMLNDGWTILHMQIMDRIAIDEDDRLHVVLQRTTTAPPPQPEARAAVPRTVTGAVVPLSQQIGDDDEYEDDEDDDVPPLPALDPDPLMPTPPKPALNTLVPAATVPAADFTRAVLSARLPPAQTLELLNNRLKETARAAFNAAPAPLPYMPLGAVK